jgi:hypothetical protein
MTYTVVRHSACRSLLDSIPGQFRSQIASRTAWYPRPDASPTRGVDQIALHDTYQISITQHLSRLFATNVGEFWILWARDRARSAAAPRISLFPAGLRGIHAMAAEGPWPRPRRRATPGWGRAAPGSALG